ncbi:MAG: B12-binding domain-containing radical SAM protein [Desulfobulbaceae bacterium]|nr:B12-binding domain-containing radical SAM protein [Desulfobulbaceae bacterium]
MNILLINMPIRIQAQPNVVPLGIGILSSLIKSVGHECTIVDLNVHRPVLSLEDIEKKLTALGQNFDMVGLSGMITTLRWQKKIASMVHRLFPKSILVSGGGLPSDFGDILFDWIPELDAVCIGEGEPLVPELLQKSPHLKGAKAVFGPRLVDNLDQVPEVDWDAFDMPTYLANPIWGATATNSSWTPFESKRSINLISSRGCPYNCRFCDRNTTGGRNYRLASTTRLITDVHEVITRFNPDFIGFVDDNFLSDKNRLDSFLPAMKKVGIKWGCHGRLNEINREWAERLADSGCVYIGFGGESADVDVLKNMNKKNPPEQMSKAVKLCQEVFITPNCTWIMGYPGESRESLRRTARFIMEHNLSQKNMFVATAYPGTDFFEGVKDKILTTFGTMENYVLELDDATKVLEHNGSLLHFSQMSDEEFRTCRTYVEAGELDKI